MRIHLLKSIAAPAAVLSVLLPLQPAEVTVANGAPAASGKTQAAAPVLKTAWGEPDLQGIWTDETTTPLQRPARYASQEFFTAAQRQELDRERSAMLDRDKRAQRGTERDVSGAYNSVFLSVKRVGARTSLIVDPPDGRIPPLTPEARKIAAAEREFRLAMLQSTETCKNKEPACSGGKYDPKPSPRRTELASSLQHRRALIATMVRRMPRWPSAA